MNIRPFQPEDLDAVVAVFRSNIPKYFTREEEPGLPLTIATSQHTEGFYEHFGFRTTEHIKDGFGPGIDNCRMRFEP